MSIFDLVKSQFVDGLGNKLTRRHRWNWVNVTALDNPVTGETDLTVATSNSVINSANISLTSDGTLGVGPLANSNLATASVLNLTSSVNRNVYGMLASTTPGAMNPIKELRNANPVGGSDIILHHDSGSATAAKDRFTINEGSTFTIRPGQSASFGGYDYTATRWLKSPSPVARVNVKSFGAKGNGSADDTVALKAARDSGLPLFFPPGVYMISVPTEYLSDPINGNGLNVRNQTSVDWSGYGATIKMASTVPKAGRTHVVVFENCTNVSIRGLTIDGNRVGRGGGGDSGTMCVFIYGGSNITVQDVILRESCQDGLAIAATNPASLATYANDIKLINVTADHSVRTGIALLNCYNVELRRCRGIRSDNALPKTGLHIEPNAPDKFGVFDVRIIDCDASDNDGEGLMVTGSTPTVTGPTGGTGNGTVTELSTYGGNAKDGDYELECITASGDAPTFKLTDPDAIVLSNTLTLTGGPNGATLFRVGGLQFKINDGTTNFGVGAKFVITGALSCARNIVVTNLSGRNNGAGLMQIGAATGVNCSVKSTDDSSEFTNAGYIYVSSAAHNVTLRDLVFSNINGNGVNKWLVYFDDSGVGHSLFGMRATNYTCQAIVSRDFTIADIELDTCPLAEAAISVVDRGIVRNVVTRRLAGVGVLVASDTGVLVENVTSYDPQSHSVRLFSANAMVRNVKAFMKGNAPAGVYPVYIEDSATPNELIDIFAKATGTDYAPSGLVRLPLSLAFRCRQCRPNPFTGTTTWDPPSLDPGDEAQTAFTVTGARPGDVVTLVHAIGLGGVTSRGDVSANDTVTVTLRLPSSAGALVNLPSHEITATVEKP